MREWGVRTRKHIETILLWPQEKHEERRSMVIKELTLQNTANGSRTALQTAENLEWRNRLSSDDVETSKWEALASSGRWALSVDRDFDATIVCDKKTWMEQLELIEQGLSQPLMTVAERVVWSFCSMFVASAHPAQAAWSYTLRPHVICL